MSTDRPVTFWQVRPPLHWTLQRALATLPFLCFWRTLYEASEGWQLESTEKMEVRKEATATIAVWDLGNLALSFFIVSSYDAFVCISAL